MKRICRKCGNSDLYKSRGWTYARSFKCKKCGAIWCVYFLKKSDYSNPYMFKYGAIKMNEKEKRTYQIQIGIIYFLVCLIIAAPVIDYFLK